jgi:hypothetical protein
MRAYAFGSKLGTSCFILWFTLNVDVFFILKITDFTERPVTEAMPGHEASWGEVTVNRSL